MFNFIFHLLVPGGKWQTFTGIFKSKAIALAKAEANNRLVYSLRYGEKSLINSNITPAGNYDTNKSP
jgi:hypothetical protein